MKGFNIVVKAGIYKKQVHSPACHPPPSAPKPHSSNYSTSHCPMGNTGRGQEETVIHADLHVSLGTFMSYEKDIVPNGFVIIQK